MKTIVEYTGGLPPNGDTVLFNSITAFPPGGGFHLLGQDWICVTITANTGTTNTVSAEYSQAASATVAASWIRFFVTPSIDFTGGGVNNTARVIIPVHEYKDVRVVFSSNGAQTVFKCSLALTDEAPHSLSSATTDTVGGQKATPVADT